eukprot:344960_1
MSFKLNADATIFIPSSNNTQNNNNNLTAKQLWRQIQCLHESISDLNIRMRETNLSLETKQSQLKSLFQLFHQYDMKTLNCITSLRKNINSFRSLHNHLSIHLNTITHLFQSNYCNYIHKYIPLQILFNDKHKIA